jgi:hypothetical protein
LERESAVTDTRSEIAVGWDLHVDRRPNWLLIRVLDQHDGPPHDEPLAEPLRHLMEEHGVYRFALELDGVKMLDNVVIRQLGLLHHAAR